MTDEEKKEEQQPQAGPEKVDTGAGPAESGPQPEAAQGPSAADMGPMPEPDFTYLVQTHFIQAMLYSGKILNPMTQKYERNKDLAKFNIELMEILEEKTKGNLDDAEKKFLEECLHQARMAYLDLKEV